MISATILAVFFVPVFFVWVRSHVGPRNAAPAAASGAEPVGTPAPTPEPSP